MERSVQKYPLFLCLSLNHRFHIRNYNSCRNFHSTMGFLDPADRTEMPSFDHEDLIADRIRKRTFSKFWRSVDPPPGIKFHENPIVLVGGMPNHGFFPVSSIDVHLASKPFAFDRGQTFEIPATADQTDVIDLENALQYADSDGFQELRNFTKQFVSRVVKPQLPNWSTIITLGGADGVGKCFDILVNPGDTVLFEEFTFNPILNTCRERGGVPVPIKLDDLATMDYAEELDNMLSHWSDRYPGLPLPKALYTIPNGHNPLGVSQPLSHKKHVYALAQKYNFFIIEDEPYGYLNFSPAEEEPNFSLSNDEFVKSLHPSYTTLDTTGRVVRVETFSKIFAPGTRLGYAIAHPQFLSYFKSSSDILTRAPSGLSQAVVYNTIVKLGGLEGWIHWITLVRNDYLRRKNVMVNALRNSEAGKKGYLQAIDPNCGMFVACKVNIPEEKKSKTTELMEKFDLLCRIEGIVVVLGVNMAVDKTFSAERGNFLRIAICAPLHVDVLTEAANRLSKAAIDLFECNYIN
ncbi:hypothetical protein FOA43_004514 [Brettanomyces nanus]|uniref:Aminotransferase class I/classII large domain-containing protein n=1 Tax=Eeniella nana TaxID=13502 RepID=A0A875S686_EENNA|nr:uncharacterized protein FOA43_004514 [Brettanomyces nanus]QPG77111.1 hypothetical protein FOA43_004514 [Brettanomyces nanus]